MAASLNREHAIDIFERHVEHVKETCPPDRLLVIDAAEGWEPLCQFLGVPVPDRPFPHLNDVGAGLRHGTRALPVAVVARAVALAARMNRN